MNRDNDVPSLTQKVVAAWNQQDVEGVAGCYAEHCTYRDPNTRGDVKGRDALRRYLTKLFAQWKMHWTVTEHYTFERTGPVVGGAFLWRAELAPLGAPTGAKTVRGMDLVILRDDLVLAACIAAASASQATAIANATAALRWPWKRAAGKSTKATVWARWSKQLRAPGRRSAEAVTAREELIFVRTQKIPQPPGESSYDLHERLRAEVVASFQAVEGPTRVVTPVSYTFDASRVTGIEGAVVISTSTCKHETPLRLLFGLRAKNWQHKDQLGRAVHEIDALPAHSRR
jgi:hypothetical protein